ncbi:MAG: class I SAM-dependent methyltransferase [Verrucomicrobiaceae bacterium]|nr:MAG: class I SAM-dependent methyltransferase [Verrucomicrobiaceae bacterium]
MNEDAFSVTLDRFTGFGAHYDAVRPSAPEALAALLLPMAGCGETAGLVVDLGSGTGLSTRYWQRWAEAVIGIEPTDSMREQAEQRGGGDRISYRRGYSHRTGLPDGCADLVICAQSLHWMEPAGTFAEAARILRPGGVFAAYDYDWPPATPFPEVDALYLECCEHSRRLEREHGLSGGLQQWDKSGHLERMESSGRFRFVRECLMHHWDQGGAERLIGLLLSQGHVQTVLKNGLARESIGLDRLQAAAESAFGTGQQPWFWSARIRIGIV